MNSKNLDKVLANKSVDQKAISERNRLKEIHVMRAYSQKKSK